MDWHSFAVGTSLIDSPSIGGWSFRAFPMIYRFAFGEYCQRETINLFAGASSKTWGEPLLEESGKLGQLA